MQQWLAISVSDYKTNLNDLQISVFYPQSHVNS